MAECLGMFLPALHRGMHPVAVLLADVFPGNVVGVLHRLFGIVLIGHNEGGFHNPVLHHLSQRVVAHRPGEVHAVLIFGRGGEVEPERQPLGQCPVDAEQGLAPGQVCIMDVMGFVVEHNQVCEVLEAFEHGTLVGREIRPWLGSQDGFDGILWCLVLLTRLVKLLDVGEEQGASRIGFCALAA